MSPRILAAGPVVTIDAPTSRDELLDAFASAFAFPGHFGHNYDALLDCLRDVEGVLVWQRPGVLAAADPAAYETVVSVLRHRVSEGGFTAVLLADAP